MLLSCCANMIFTIYFIVSFSFSSRFINEWVCVNDIFFIFWSLLFLYEETILNDVYNFNNPAFLYVSGIFLYTTCTIVFLGIWFIIKSNPQKTYDGLKIIHHIGNISLYLFFTLGLIINYKKNFKLLNFERS